MKSFQLMQVVLGPKCHSHDFAERLLCQSRQGSGHAAVNPTLLKGP